MIKPWPQDEDGDVTEFSRLGGLLKSYRRENGRHRFYSGPRKLDKAISVKDIILSPTQGGLPDEQEEAQFYA